jgi:hypothetical protein
MTKSAPESILTRTVAKTIRPIQDIHFNESDVFEEVKSENFRKLVKERRNLADVKKKLVSDPNGNGYDRALAIQNHNIAIEHLTELLKLEKINP